eukprot:CAMPEP_0194173188 /NCGR_PEP_ID=MMETSP0154-20130528/7556_1 /TAXON_ID=1049557 /ORGANISM="Thalassiothrix antarctica, Strain L6-D1" /LENGTH=508 /DNA_ID=CAMNT_0038886153 /DNA_START=46 /DNA_END=1572 /DNA_ORIENTATION=-
MGLRITLSKSRSSSRRIIGVSISLFLLLQLNLILFNNNSNVVLAAASSRLPPYYFGGRSRNTAAFQPRTSSLSWCHHRYFHQSNNNLQQQRRNNNNKKQQHSFSIVSQRSPNNDKWRNNQLVLSASKSGTNNENNNIIISKKKKKKRYKKSKSKTLFRAERVLSNRSGKTRSECRKLFKKHIVSILDVNNNNKEQQGEEDFDPENLRVISPEEQIPMTARIFMNKEFEVPGVAPLLMIYHKPKWMLSTMGEDRRQRLNLHNLKFAYSSRMHPVGRLDYDSSGLLLFSSDGKLTQYLLHPKFDKQKEYVAVVTGLVQEDRLKEILQEGVELVDLRPKKKGEGGSSITTSGEDRPIEDRHDGNDISSGERESDGDTTTGTKTSSTTTTLKETLTTKADLLGIKHWSKEDVKPYLDDIQNKLPKEYNVTEMNLRGYMNVFDATELSEIRLVVTEGKHRMVRRLLASCGHTVVDLKRERIGIIELNDLPVSTFRNLTIEEAEWAESVLLKKK